MYSSSSHRGDGAAPPARQWGADAASAAAPAEAIAAQVHVVQDQHDGRGHRRKRRPQPGDDRAGHRTHRGGQRVEHPLIDRLDRIERCRDVAEQDLRVVVPLVDRHPREGLAVTLGPLRQQRRLAVAGRATTETTGRGSPRARRSIRDERRTVPGRITGRQSLDATKVRTLTRPHAVTGRPADARRSRPCPDGPLRFTSRRRCAPAGVRHAGFGCSTCSHAERQERRLVAALITGRRACPCAGLVDISWIRRTLDLPLGTLVPDERPRGHGAGSANPCALPRFIPSGRCPLPLSAAKWGVMQRSAVDDR